MRPISGAAPGASIADHWTAMRDNSQLARPANPSEAVATGDIHTPMPPSRAHLKRLTRPRLVPPPRAYPAPTDEQLAQSMRLNFHKRVIADLGGSLTIVGTHEARIQPREPGVARPLTTEQRMAYAEQRAVEEDRQLLIKVMG